MSPSDRPLARSNTRVKEAAKLRRRSVRTERRLFLADGPKAVAGAIEAGCVEEVFATSAAAGSVDASYDGQVVLVEDSALASLSESVSPAGVVAVCRPVDVPLAYLLAELAAASGPPLVICADVSEPGNAGTVVRTADAVGAGGVVLAGQSVDAYNAKTVRASVGSLFHVPLSVAAEPADVVRRAQAAGLMVLAADGAGEVELFAADELVAGPVAWLFGNEARGLPEDLAALADHRVRIPITGRAESLNLATAAAVCLYASLRARTER